jgi:Thiol-disulfide isomerase and thioredoxins
MKRLLLIAALAIPYCLPQDLPEDEQRALSQALSEAGSSPIELVRALEAHLAKFPMTVKRAEIERLLVKGAIENKDERRIVLYGERVLTANRTIFKSSTASPGRCWRATLKTLPSARSSTHSATSAWLPRCATNRPVRAAAKPSGKTSSTAVSTARCRSRLGPPATSARWTMPSRSRRGPTRWFPTAEAAREIGRWLARSGKEEGAIQYIADAFVLADPRSNDVDRASDRARMGELYRKVKGSEKGLGDVILEAYDRTSAQMAERKTKLAAADPNIQASNVLAFTLTGLKGDKLQLASLQGKAVVFDFWATWCGPCRAQHPLYEQVKQKYRMNPDVVFVSVDTDENHALVAPFVTEHKWNQSIYFEDGLVKRLEINSIPTTIVLNRHGEIVSRLNGFVPERFVDMLSDRIEEALK